MFIDICGVTKKYGRKVAIDNLSTNLTVGIYGLLGPNGAGKTTLMNMMVDIIKPTEGKICLNGKNITNMGKDYRKILGYLPQHIGMYNEFTGRDMLMYFAAINGISDRQRASNEVDKLLNLVNLSADAKKRIGHYSGGMKQRLGIAQALINDPAIIIFDEPTAGLDPKERIRFKNIISRLSSEKIIILATHIVSDVESTADRIILLKEGKLIDNNIIQNYLNQIEKKVWAVNVDYNIYDKLSAKHTISKVENKNESINLRIISNTQPVENAINVAPALDDYYLLHFGETGK